MMTEPIKLPPLVGTLAIMPPHHQKVIKAYGEACARAAIEPYAKRIAELEAQKSADLPLRYEQALSELIEKIVPGLDSGDILADARKATIEADRQARGEPVAWYLPSADGYDSMFRDHATVKSCTGNPWDGWLPLYTAAVSPQPQQQAGDPVAWLCTPDFEGEQFLATTQGAADTLEKDGWSVQPLYEAPQPQQIPEGYKPVSPCLENLCDRIIKWRHCMSYNDSYFGEPRGELKRIAAAMERAMLEAAPEPKEPR